MKRFAVTLLIFLLAAGTAWGGRNPADNLTFEAAQKQAYWYSLYNVAHLTMFAGMGEIMKGGGMTGIIEWLKGGGVQKAELVKDMYMISSAYQQGDPQFTQKVDLDNKRSMGWDRNKMNQTLIPSVQAFTIIKSVTKNFHRDYHETKDNQRVAIAMYPEAKEMAKLLAEAMVNEKGLFVSLSAAGKKEKPLPFDQISVLWAFSDLALTSSDPAVPPYNDADLSEWSIIMADQAFEATKMLMPQSIIEKSLAIEAYGRYAAATENSGLRKEALKLIKDFARQILKANPKTITEMGLTVYGLGEAYRLTGDYDNFKKALEIFNNDMEALWDAKAGIYATSKNAKKYIYTPFDVGSVLAAFNTVLWLAIPPYENPLESGPSLARKRYVRFFENAVVISGMQQASGIALVEPIYLKREPQIHFAHPALPLPEKAGSGFGRAPVYAGEVTYENGKWMVTDPRFKTKDAMFLATMSVILNRHQPDCFFPMERLTAKLLADAGI
jgi:tetratricopeptide (TPR) repeat protein